MGLKETIANEMALVTQNINEWKVARQELIDQALQYWGITDEKTLMNVRGNFGKTKGKPIVSLFDRFLKEKGLQLPEFPKTSVNLGNTELAFDIGVDKWELNVDELNIMKKNPDAQKWYQRIKNKDGILGQKYKGKPFSALNSGNKMNVARAYVEQRVLPNLPLNEPVIIKGGSISSQALGTGKKASGDAKTKRYRNWWIDTPTSGFTEEGGKIIFRNTGQPITGKPWVKGAVPDNVVRENFEEYIKNRDIRDATGAKRAKGQFFHKGMGYTFSSQGKGRPSSLRAPDGTPFKVVASKDLSLKEANRRAIKFGATPKLNPWEWESMNALYDFAGKHGYHVDHKIPLDAGVEAGGIHHWSNLQVLDANDNLVKGAKEGVEEALGITPKMTATLQTGPFTLEDWTNATSKIGTLEKQKAEVAQRAVGRGLKKYAKFAAVGGLSVGLTAWELAQRSQAAQEDPSLLNKLQQGISGLEATTDAAGLAFAPLEGVSLVAGLTNLGIDALRDRHRRATGRYYT